MDEQIRAELLALGLNEREISRLDAMVTARLAALAQQVNQDVES